jgi:hypothetical protein
MDLQTRLHVWFMHDGAPPRFLLTVREFFTNGYDEVDHQHGQLFPLISIPYIFIFGDIYRLSLVLQQSVEGQDL